LLSSYEQLYYKQKHREIPKDVLVKAIAVVKKLVAPKDKKRIIEAYILYGTQEWAGELGIHFGWGMAVRNQLRKAGLTDDIFPTGNLDDYYISIIEDAVCKNITLYQKLINMVGGVPK
jgi:hypothetical protein